MPEPTAISIPAALADAARTAPLQVALEHDGLRRTYARLADEVSRLARGLSELGVRPGQRVAIVSGMHAEAVIAFHAACRIGAVAVLHDGASTPRELRRAFEDHAAVVAIVEPDALDAVRALPPDLHPKAVIAIAPRRRTVQRLRSAVHLPVASVRSLRRRTPRRPPVADRVIAWRDLTATAPLPAEHPMPRPRDLALLQYTIGRDGELLGAMLTHENLLADARQLARIWDPAPHAVPHSAQVICATVPLHEAAGASVGLVAALLGGHQLVLAESSEDVVAAVRRGRLTIVTGTPALLARVTRLAQETGCDLGTLRGALALQPGLGTGAADAWAGVLGHPVDVAYVRAECGVALGGRYDDHSPDGLGAALPGVQVRIGGDDELRIAGVQVFHGYWNRPDETALALSGDGWVRTGDEVRQGEALDCAGILVRSRRREIISADGRVISPREVAAVLLAHPDVAAAEVDGHPIPGGGESVRARVVLREAATADIEELRAFAAERLSPSKVPGELLLVGTPYPSDAAPRPLSASADGTREPS